VAHVAVAVGFGETDAGWGEETVLVEIGCAHGGPPENTELFLS
jgi:hypothetical protein